MAITTPLIVGPAAEKCKHGPGHSPGGGSHSPFLFFYFTFLNLRRSEFTVPYLGGASPKTSSAFDDYLIHQEMVTEVAEVFHTQPGRAVECFRIFLFI
jgi:hypothetical protein